jgi:hypothetical protein
VGLIAKKLKRSPGAIYARISSFKKMSRESAFGEQPRSLPSERLAHAQASAMSCDITEGTYPAGGCRRKLASASRRANRIHDATAADSGLDLFAVATDNRDDPSNGCG